MIIQKNFQNQHPSRNKKKCIIQATTYKLEFAHNTKSRNIQPILAIYRINHNFKHTTTSTSITTTHQLIMNEEALSILIAACILMAIVVSLVTCACITGCSSDDEIVDEENPRCLEGCRETRAEKRKDSGTILRKRRPSLRFRGSLAKNVW